MSLLVVFEIFGLFVQTMTADEKYILCNSENSPQPIEMQLSEKQTTFSDYSASFLKSTSNLKHFEKDHDLDTLCISDITDSETLGQTNV